MSVPSALANILGAASSSGGGLLYYVSWTNGDDQEISFWIIGDIDTDFSAGSITDLGTILTAGAGGTVSDATINAVSQAASQVYPS